MDGGAWVGESYVTREGSEDRQGRQQGRVVCGWGKGEGRGGGRRERGRK